MEGKTKITVEKWLAKEVITEADLLTVTFTSEELNLITQPLKVGRKRLYD